MNKTLLILAAGMGSRFGGLKQIAPLGPNGEFIIDYSIYDAIKSGFNKVVFLIKEENYELFKSTIGSRVEPLIHVEYCFQKNDNVPDNYEIPSTRVKPLGTAHAILCCKDKIKENFAIINADDFYGRDAFMVAASFLDKTFPSPHYGMVGYKVINTITDNGSVKRGVCQVEDDNLVEIVESSVEEVDNKIVATPLNGSEPFIVDENQTVSMNMFLFTPSIFKYIEEQFIDFLEQNKNDLSQCEYLIPDIVFNCIKTNKVVVDVLKTDASWYGVTYKEDSDYVRKSLSELVEKNEYPNKLW